MATEHWKDQPEAQDSARSYLSLSMEPAAAAKIVKSFLQSTVPAAYKAKDILRASGLPLLSADNKHVAYDLGKVKAGKKLSPVLLVRGEPLLIADRYHRVCASYHLDKNVDIPCRIVSRL